MAIKQTGGSYQIIEDGYSVTLIISAESIDEVKKILLTGMPGWNLSGKGSEKDDDVEEAAEEDEEEKPKRGRPAKKAAKKQSKKAAAEEDEDEEDESEDEEDEDDSEDEDSDDEEDEEEEKAKAAASGKITISPKDIAKMDSLGKLRSILEYLIETKKVRNVSSLLKICNAVKPKVQALGRISDLEKRIPQIVKLLDPKIKNDVEEPAEEEDDD